MQEWSGRERTDWLLSLEARALLAAVSLTAAWQRNLSLSPYNMERERKKKRSSQVPSLLAERARSECARPMRAVEGNLTLAPPSNANTREKDRREDLQSNISQSWNGVSTHVPAQAVRRIPRLLRTRKGDTSSIMFDSPRAFTSPPLLMEC